MTREEYHAKVRAVMDGPLQCRFRADARGRTAFEVYYGTRWVTIGIESHGWFYWTPLHERLTEEREAVR